MIWDAEPALWRSASGLVEIRYYGVLTLVALVVAWAATIWFARRAGISAARAFAAYAVAMVGALVAGHAAHMVFYELDVLLETPSRMLYVGAGFASHGAIVGGLLGALLVAGKNKRLELLDAVASGGVFSIPFYRIANFTNSEIVGRPWDGPWAVAFPRYDCPGYPMYRGCEQAVLRHPSQLYEAAIGVLLIALAIYLQRRWRDRLRGGVITLMLLFAYGLTRFAVELVKQDDVGAPLFTMGQWLSMPLIAVTGAMLVMYRTRLAAPAPA